MSAFDLLQQSVPSHPAAFALLAGLWHSRISTSEVAPGNDLLLVQIIQTEDFSHPLKIREGLF